MAGLNVLEAHAVAEQLGLDMLLLLTLTNMDTCCGMHSCC
jgi:hypothetical protein